MGAGKKTFHNHLMANTYEREAQITRDSFADIALIAVGITDQIDAQFLAHISGSPGVTRGQQQLGRDYFTAPDFTELDSVLHTVSTGICERPEPIARELQVHFRIKKAGHLTFNSCRSRKHCLNLGAGVQGALRAHFVCRVCATAL